MPFFNFQRSEKDKYLSEARKFRRRGEFDRAGDYFFMAGAVDEALDAYVEGGHHTLAAQMLEKRGDLRRAAEMYVQARDLRAAAGIYQRLGDPKRASQLFEKLGELFKAAQIEEETRSYKRAAELYQKAGKLDRAAECYARDGEHDRAAETLEEHLSKPATGAEGAAAAEKQWATAAELYWKAKRYRKAAEIWRRIGQHVSAAEAFERWGDPAAAIDMYLRAQDSNRAYELFRRTAEGSVEPKVVAELHYQRGAWREAADRFRDLGDAARSAECYEKAGEGELAAEQYEKMGDLEVAADLLYGAGRHARASELYEKALRPLMAARAAAESGDTERAARLFGEAREPVEAAKSWKKLDQPEKAIELLQSVQPHQEGYGEATVMLADLFRAKGFHSIALEKYRVAIEGKGVDDGSIDAYYGLAQLHEDQGEGNKAIELYERIVAVNFGYRDAAVRLEGLRRAAQVAVTPARGLAVPGGVGTTTDPQQTAELSPAPAMAAPGPPTIATGQVGGRYEIVGRVGDSGRGEVYKAWDSSLGRTVVLKRLTPAEGMDDGQTRRYLHEAQQASKLHHSHIVAIYDAVDLPEGRFVATEYVFGENLRELLRRENQLTPARTVEIASQILLALEYAHEVGITHRNLRPENVLIAEKTHVKVADFGMNRRVVDLQAEAQSAASPLHYVAPEQIRGEKLDGRTDLYALGCLTYEMLLGRPPFTGANLVERHLGEDAVPPSRLDPQVPPALDKMLLRCLQKDPAKRYQTARSAYEELRSFDFIPGQRIADRYELLREIGAGGMGKVFLARDLELDEKIAMKVLRPEFGTDALVEQRFLREIKLARRIVHPSVVKVYDFGKWKNIKYITMEFIDGISLDEFVRRTRPPNIREISRFVVQICEALDAAHRLGVVHRDIKPQNVLISSDRRAKLVDFGIARIEEHEDLTSSRLIIGSPKYMSPEQISGKNIDNRTDIYSLGVVMYYCVTGVEPFSAEDTNSIIMKQLNENPTPPSQINPDLPPWLEMIILKCLVKDPRGRYQRAIDISRDILARMR